MKFKRVLAEFEKMKQVRSKYEDKWKVLDAFDRGEQWNISSIPLPSWIPKPVTNYIYVVKSTKKASLLDSVNEGKLLPLSPMDAEPVEQLDKLRRNKWKKLNVEDTIRRTADRAILLGTGVTYVGYDPEKIIGGSGTRFEGELIVKTIDPSGFYIDPVAFNLESARFCATATRTTYSKLLEDFPDEVKKLEKKLKKGDVNQGVGEVYDRDYATNQEDAITLVTFYSKTKNGGIEVYYFTSSGVLIKYQKETYMTRFPFAILYDIKQINEFWGKSVCELILDNQKIVNKVESIIASMGVMLQNPPTYVSVDSGIDVKKFTKYRNAPSSVWGVRGDPRLAVYIPQLPEIPATLLQLNEVAKNNIKEIAGLTEAYLGDSVGSLTTSTGVNSLIERSKVRDKDQQFELNEYIKGLTSLIIDTLRANMVIEQTFRVDDDDPNTENPYDFITINPESVRNINYDFYIDAQASTPQTPEKLQNDAMQAMQLQMQFQPAVPLITNEEFVKAMNWSDNFKETVLSRMREDNMINDRNKIMDIITMAIETTNPESELFGTSTEDLVQAGLQILKPQTQKLGNVGDVQQAQATAPTVNTTSMPTV